MQAYISSGSSRPRASFQSSHIQRDKPGEKGDFMVGANHACPAQLCTAPTPSLSLCAYSSPWHLCFCSPSGSLKARALLRQSRSPKGGGQSGVSHSSCVLPASSDNHLPARAHSTFLQRCDGIPPICLSQEEGTQLSRPGPFIPSETVLDFMLLPFPSLAGDL